MTDLNEMIIKLDTSKHFKLSVTECPFYEKNGNCSDTNKPCNESMDCECINQFNKIN
jgi:hypothetical protein